MKSVETIKEKDFLEFYNSRTYNANCFNDDGSLNKNYNSFKEKHLLNFSKCFIKIKILYK